jgi:hypothetical protein
MDILIQKEMKWISLQYPCHPLIVWYPVIFMEWRWLLGSFCKVFWVELLRLLPWMILWLLSKCNLWSDSDGTGSCDWPTTVSHHLKKNLKLLRTDGDFCHEGGTQKLPPKFKIVEAYWHDHSLESSWGALSDGTICPFSACRFNAGISSLH